MPFDAQIPFFVGLFACQRVTVRLQVYRWSYCLGKGDHSILLFEIREIFSRLILEELTEMGGVGKAEKIGYLLHAKSRIQCLSFCLQGYALPYLATCRGAGGLFNDFVQVVGSDA